jgi:hypothetical protein
MDWTQNASGENAFGWTLVGDRTSTATDVFKFTSDDFSFTGEEGEPIDVKPPYADAQIETIYQHPPGNVTDVEFTSYEAGSKLFTLGSNWTLASGQWTCSTTMTRRAIVIEVCGLGAHYFPSAQIIIPAPNAVGVSTLVNQMVQIKAHCGTTLTTGYGYIPNIDSV